MVDKQLISEIKNSVNIVDVIGEVVQLTKAGRNFLGLCPFHGEKTPSFNVVEDKQLSEIRYACVCRLFLQVSLGFNKQMGNSPSMRSIKRLPSSIMPS